ncbi:MAG: hypothetical protein LBC75_07565 [Fibromonadaceae bacterium]|jgi:hypothetical protein|nr:hypothetical protein [Fibromonadaceae bacterium]
MANKNTGPQYLTSDGRFTNERPKWMRPRGCETTPDISEFLPKESKYPAKKKYEVRQLSDFAAEKIAGVLHVMLNDKSKS